MRASYYVAIIIFAILSGYLLWGWWSIRKATRHLPGYAEYRKDTLNAIISVFGICSFALLRLTGIIEWVRWAMMIVLLVIVIRTVRVERSTLILQIRPGEAESPLGEEDEQE